MTTHSFRAGLLLLTVLVSPTSAQRRPPETPRVGQEPLPALLERTSRKAAGDADELQKLLVERYNEAVKEVANLNRLAGIRTARNDASLVDAVRRLVEAEMDLTSKREDRLTLLKEYIEFLKRAEQQTELMLRAGGAGGMTESDLSRLRYARLSAEIRLLRTKRDKADKP